MKRYTEIIRLRDLLIQYEVEHEFTDNSDDSGESYQIKVFNKGKEICSVIQSPISYGSNANLLELKGLLTKEEKKIDAVKGFLNADEVLRRILNKIGGKNGKN